MSKLVAAGRYDDAEKRADAFLKTTPKDAQMRFLKGVILAQRGKRDEATDAFTGLTQDFPELPEPYNNLAVLYAAQGDYDKARVALETSIRVSPNYATAYENLGDVYEALAARAYQDAGRHDARNASAARKLSATRALLAGNPSTPAAAPATSGAAPAGTTAGTGDTSGAASLAATAAARDLVRSQRNFGLASPAGPRVSVGGAQSVSPEIVVPADAVSVLPNSNVVAVETTPPDEVADTSTLHGASRPVADAAQPISAVTAAVDRWAATRGLTTRDLQIRVDGADAVATFRTVARADAGNRTGGGAGSAGASGVRVLTLRRDGDRWTVVADSTGP